MNSSGPVSARARSVTCSYVYEDNNGVKMTCHHPVYRGTRCIFHEHEHVQKAAIFAAAFDDLLRTSNSSKDISRLDFKGFVFPASDWSKRRFEKPADFRKAHFCAALNSRNADFAGEVLFSGATFDDKADFHGVHFHGRVTFNGVTFAGRTTFSGSRFDAGTTFHGCKFRRFATWRDCRFQRPVVLQSNTFNEDVDFGLAVFQDGVDFQKTLFHERAVFEGTQFTGEVVLSEVHAKHLKKFSASGACLDGAVLESAELWDKNRIEGFSLRGAVLLALNLARKEVVNCDFTGAVFKAVLTQGWKPDPQTVANTKFIFTDYEVREFRPTDGIVRWKYRPKDESRVPTEGNFGEGEHAKFTLLDYLRDPLRWSLALNVPSWLRTAVISYLQFFTDFMEMTQGVPVEIRTRSEGSKLRVEFMTDTEEQRAAVQQSFDEYRRNAEKPFAQLRLETEVRADVSEARKEFFLLRMQQENEKLKAALESAQALNQQQRETLKAKDQTIEVLVAGRGVREVLEAAPKPQQLFRARFILRADLASSTSLKAEYPQLAGLLPTYVEALADELRDVVSVKRVKTEGDGFLVFAEDAKAILNTVNCLIASLEIFCLDHDIPMKGFRCILGFGLTLRAVPTQDGEDCYGPEVDELSRLDQPMKEYIRRHELHGSRVWCTAAFRNAVAVTIRHLTFRKLEPFDLDKGHPSSGDYFSIER